jgi:diphosphate--fructose-6-phosphate 1-phosphotransferase
LRFQAARKNVKLYGFINGLKGLMEEKIVEINEESFKPFRNLGGYDYLGRSHDYLRTSAEQLQAAKVCKENGFTGLVMIGATHTLSDACILSEYFMANGVDTRVVAIPATVNGNIRHSFISTAIGFDTASKVYSQLIGNMLSDSASAIKYWYFIRLMGRDPSHLVLECAMQTHPNLVIISEECSQRGETLIDIVNRICDMVEERANKGKNYGCVLIPEGLLNYVAAYKNLIDEINQLFANCTSRKEAKVLSQQLYDNEQSVMNVLTPWSYSLYQTLPEFLKKQLLFEREIEGTTKISQLETEKLIAYYVE